MEVKRRDAPRVAAHDARAARLRDEDRLRPATVCAHRLGATRQAPVAAVRPKTVTRPAVDRAVALHLVAFERLCRRPPGRPFGDESVLLQPVTDGGKAPVDFRCDLA